MADFRVPWSFGQEADDLAFQSEVERLTRAAYPPQPVPQPPQSPDVRLGRFNLSGNRLDSAAAAVLASLQNAPQPQGFGSGLATGLAQGLAGGRVRQANLRQQQFEAERERAKQYNEAAERFRGQATLAAERSRREAAKPTQAPRGGFGAQTFTLPDGTVVPMTASIASALAKKAGVITPNVSISTSVSPDVARQAKSVAKAIVEGRQPPKLTNMGRGGLAGEVRRELEDTHQYNLATAEQDFDATKSFLRSANNPLSTRMRGSAMTAFQSTRLIDKLSSQLKTASPNLRSPLTPLNRLTLTAAMNGPDPKVRALARQLDGQIATVVFELGNVNMGGNSPTDQGMKRAAKELSSDWDDATLAAMTELARENLKIRLNSINQVRAYTTKGIEINEPEAGGQGSPAPATPAVSGKTQGQEFLDRMKKLRAGSKKP